MELSEVSSEEEQMLTDREAEKRLRKVLTLMFGLVALFSLCGCSDGYQQFLYYLCNGGSCYFVHEHLLWLSFGSMGLFVADRLWR